MLNIPLDLDNVKADRLRALLTHGEPEIVIVDDVMNGSPLYVVIARGEARKFVQAAIESTTVEDIEAADALDAAVPEPPVKVVKVRDGVHAAQPGTLKPN